MVEHPNPSTHSEAQNVPAAADPDSATSDVGTEADANVMATAAMDQVQAAADRLRQSATQRPASAMPAPELTGPVATSVGHADLSMLSDVHLGMTVELGRTRMLVDDVLNLESGAVVELDKAAGDPVDILVNGRPVARGEVLVLDDTFCIRISEILSSGEASVTASGLT